MYLEPLETRLTPSTIPLGTAANFGILFEGGGTGNPTLNLSNDTTINGNIGISDTASIPTNGQFNANGGVVNGVVYFSGAATGSGTGTITGGLQANTTSGSFAPDTALATVNALSSSLAGQTGTNVAINVGNNQTQTIDESMGTLDTVNGTTYRVFTVTSFNLQAGLPDGLVINGDGSGDPVVLNVAEDVHLQGAISLSGGLTDDMVMFNIIGGNNLEMGPTLQSSGSAATNVVHGIFVDVNGVISTSELTIDGRLFGGDSSNLQFVSNSFLNAPPAPPSQATPTIVTTASPAIMLGTTAPTISDSAVVSGANNATGSLVFTLSGPNGFSYSTSDPLTGDGNGTYSASDMLPTTGTVAGTYTWSVSYAGDANNNPASETGSASNGEQTVVSPASPTIVTTAGGTVTVGRRHSAADQSTGSLHWAGRHGVALRLVGRQGQPFYEADNV